MCQDFLRGYCPVGSECKKKHQDAPVKRRTTKKVAPAKPKRTSIVVIPQDDDVTAATPTAPCAATAAGSAQRVPRYYENVQEVDEEYRATTAAEQLEPVESISGGKSAFFISNFGHSSLPL